MWRALFFSLCLAGGALAGVVVTERAGLHELRRTGELVGTYQTHAGCIAAVPAPMSSAPVEYTCSDVTNVTIVGNCDDAPRPRPGVYKAIDAKPGIYADPANNVPTPGRSVLADGTVEYTFAEIGDLEAHACPDGVNYWNSRTQWVAKPFPVCGAIEAVPEPGQGCPP